MEPALSAVGTVVRTSRAVGYVLCCCVSRSAGPHPLAVAVFGSFSVSSSPPVRPWCLPLFTNILISNIFIYDIDDYEYFFFLLSLLYFLSGHNRERDTTRPGPHTRGSSTLSHHRSPTGERPGGAFGRLVRRSATRPIDARPVRPASMRDLLGTR